MDESIKDDEIRMAVVKLLEEKGYKVRNTASGSGVPKFSRVEIEKGAEKLTCAIKTTARGRISFTRNPNGTYPVLNEADRVIYAHHTRSSQYDQMKIKVSMFNKETVLKAFEANYKAKAGRGMEHTPLWVNPIYEGGWRLTGSGFQDKALWSEIISAGEVEAFTTPEAMSAETSSVDPSSEIGIMDRIKAMLSEHMGVRPDQLEIDVRVKI